MTPPRRLTYIALAVMILALAVAVFHPLRFWSSGRYQAQVVGLHGELQSGATREHVRQMMQSGRYPDLTLHQVDDRTWFAEAPLEFGAGSWILVIDFTGDRVAAARVRTHDGRQQHPAQAPLDKIFPAPVPIATGQEPTQPPCVPVAKLARAPRKTHDVKPNWKSLADVRTSLGLLIYEVTIGPSGKVVEVKRIRRDKPQGPAEKIWDLYEAAIAQWEFEPSTVNGQPASVCMTVTVNIDI